MPPSIPLFLSASLPPLLSLHVSSFHLFTFSSFVWSIRLLTFPSHLAFSPFLHLPSGQAAPSRRTMLEDTQTSSYQLSKPATLREFTTETSNLRTSSYPRISSSRCVHGDSPIPASHPCVTSLLHIPASHPCFTSLLHTPIPSALPPCHWPFTHRPLTLDLCPLPYFSTRYYVLPLFISVHFFTFSPFHLFTFSPFHLFAFSSIRTFSHFHIFVHSPSQGRGLRPGHRRLSGQAPQDDVRHPLLSGSRGPRT